MFIHSLSGIYTLSDPAGGDPTIASGSVEVLIQPGLGGDHNRNGELDCGDLDKMTRQISQGSTDILFDMNQDGAVDFADLEISGRDNHDSYFGDANCDGEFNSTDLVHVFVPGLYEQGPSDDAVYSTGDWNGDGEFNSSDLVVAFADGGYEMGPRGAVAGVPEPTGLTSFVLGLVGLMRMRRRR